MKDNKAHFSFD